MIRIQNIYYMLAYAFQILNQQGYASCAAEAFENTADLLSAILIRESRLRLSAAWDVPTPRKPSP